VFDQPMWPIFYIFRERAEREKEAAKNNENIDSDDDDVVFGNVRSS
jgi:hypothetical protein